MYFNSYIFLLFDRRKIDFEVTYDEQNGREEKNTRQTLSNFISGEGENILKLQYFTIE